MEVDMSSENIVILNDEDFENEVLKSSKPVLVDFWAEWCGPCKSLLPVIDDIADNYSDKIKVCKLNVDECKNTAAKFNIMSIPTVLIFKNGEVANQLVGAMPKALYVRAIDAVTQ